MMYFEFELNNIDKRIKKIERKQNGFLIIPICSLILLIYILYAYFNNLNLNYTFYMLITVLGFIISSLIQDYYNKKKHEYYVRKQIVETYIKKQNHEFSNDHYYKDDCSKYFEELNVVGKYSLFEYINFAYSKTGKKRLMERFKNTNNDLENIQQEVRYLADRKEFIIDLLCVLSHLKDFDLEEIVSLKKRNEFLKYNYYIDLFITILTITSFFIFDSSICMLICFIKISLSYFYSSIYNKRIHNNLIDLINILEDVDGVLENSLYVNVGDEIHECLHELKGLKLFKLLDSLDRNLISHMIFNVLFNITIFKYYFIDKMLEGKDEYLKKICDNLAHLEVIISLSTIQILNDDYCYPVVSDHYSFENLKNPLIHNCVANSFDGKYFAHVITGSNMAGKTSFLRTIALNAILMNAGSAVIGKAYQSPVYHVYSSLSINDDLENGISTFYEELSRIKEMLDGKNRDEKLLIVIDEIFKGTNYHDRMIGAHSVLDKLNDKNVQMFVSTHDYELCNHSNIDYYYFNEYYDDTNIHFDYILKEGKYDSGNALYLMKKLEIID